MDPPLPIAAVLRRTPEDFVVEEMPLYAPSGKGEHLYVTFTKRGLTTPDAVHALARALEVDPRGAGIAGMKDRHAVTTQTVSFPFPIARDAEAAMARVAVPGVTIVSAARHDHKLKTGHLEGNRFTIALADVPEAEAEALAARIRALGETGVPNTFGPQRFGRDGDNPERALAWLAGRERGPRGARDQRFLFSSLQSLLFNRVLEKREAAGTWATVLPGDVAKKRDSGGLFTVPAEGPELEDARERARAGALGATGPMFGAKMRWPEGEPLAIEREVLAGVGVEVRLDAFRHLGEGTRRPLRLFVEGMSVEVRASGPLGTGRAVVVARFVLPKGGYATTVLGRACRLVDVTARSPAASGTEPEAPPDATGDDAPEP